MLQMTNKDLIKLFNSGVPLHLQFLESIENLETIIDEHMRATVTYATYDSKGEDFETIKVVVNVTPFKKYNEKFLKSNWYDNNRVAKLTYEQAGVCKNGVEILYLMPDDLDFNVVNTKSIKLYKEYIKADSQLSYVEWLEAKV